MFPVRYELNIFFGRHSVFKGLSIKMINFLSLVRTLKRSLR
jgi:hypothetical protein